MRTYSKSPRWTHARWFGSALLAGCAVMATADEPAAKEAANEESRTLPPIAVVEESTETPTAPVVVATEESSEAVVSEAVVSGAHRMKGACPPGRFWVRKELLLWWMDGQDVPPLVTTGAAGQPLSSAGVLGQPGTQVLFGGDQINDDLNLGGRFSAGFWLDRCHTIGIQGSFFFLGDNDDDFSTSSDGSTILARPFFDANPATNAQNSELVSYPGVIAGSVGVTSSTSVLGADALLRKNLTCASGCVTCDYVGSGHFRVKNLNCCRIDMISGFRYFNVDDDININENLTALGNGPVAPGTTFLVNDSFQTDNDFYGYDLGAVGSVYKGRWSLDVTGRIAIGAMYQQANISGSTVVTVPGAGTTTTQGGLLTQPTNIGSYDNTEFAVIPELGFNVGYQVTCRVRVYAGYTFIYVSDVVRAGEQIDPVVNTTQIGGGTLNGPARPAFAFNGDDLWLHGLNFGCELRF